MTPVARPGPGLGRVDDELVSVDGLTIGPADGGPPVVDGVGFAVRRGEAVALVGRSGAGKTTTALALLGHVEPGLAVKAGTVRVASEDVLAPAIAARLRGHAIAYLGQDPASDLHPTRRLGAQLREAAGSEAGVARLLTAVDLPTDRGFRRRYAHQISGGQARRAAFALVLAGEPDVLVLDEPTAGLDAVLARAVRDLIGELATRHAVVLVSHDRALVDAVATRTVELSAGHLPTPPRGAPAIGAAATGGVRATGTIAGRDEATAAPPAAPPPGGTSADVTSSDAPAPGGVSVPDVLSVPEVLSVAGLRAWHGRTPVLVDVDLVVPAGGCVAVVGPSGSGKSTLARCVAGIHRGRVAATMTLDGASVPVAGRRPREQRRPVALVPQDSVAALNPRETVRRALLRAAAGDLGAPIGTGPRPSVQAYGDAVVTELLGQVGLGPGHAERRPGALSGGERQRVSVARALACRPRLLLCDEVTSALDTRTGERLMDLLAALRARLGLGVLLITHDLSAAARHADWVLVLADGRIVEQGTPGTLSTSGSHPVTRALFEADRPVAVRGTRPRHGPP